MSQLPRYESYKDSGVQWLGEIPSHWDVKQLKFAVTCNDEALGENTEPDYEMLYVDISSVSLTDGIKHKEELLFENAPSRARRVVKSGDVLVSTVRTYLKAITYVESAEKNLIASTGFAVLRPSEKFDSKFIGYWIQSEGMVGNIVANSVGVSYPAINSTDLVRLPIVELPLSEQKFIADFLDKRLAQVDALIAKQETLLEKLAEQRVALISHAVTKGLNPDVNLKKSNSEILGSYPETWKVKRLRFDIETNPSKAEIQLDERELVSFIPMEAVSAGGGLDLSNERMISEVSSGYTYFADGDVVVAKITPCFENGKASIAENLHQGIAFGTTELHVLRCKENILNKFLFFIIQSDKFMKYGESEMYGAGGQKRVPERFIKNYLIALPPLDEQQEICDFIEGQLSHLDGLVEKVESTISTFNEYRSTLITQVVTGKIDVRNLKVN